MEQKPLYYDGSGHNKIDSTDSSSSQEGTFEITDEMRANIGRNPYSLDTEK